MSQAFRDLYSPTYGFAMFAALHTGGVPVSRPDSDGPTPELPKRRARLSTYVNGTIERRRQGCDCDMCMAAERREAARIAYFKKLNPPSRKGLRRRRR